MPKGKKRENNNRKVKAVGQKDYELDCRYDWWFKDRLDCVVMRLDQLGKTIKSTTIKRIIKRQSELTGQNETDIADAWAKRLRKETDKLYN